MEPDPNPFAGLSIPEAVAKAVEFHQRGALDVAEQVYRRILEVEPEHPTALTWLGMALYETGRHEAGKATMERAIRADPDDLLSRWNLAMAYVEEGRDDEAIEHLERAVRYGNLDPEVIKVLRLLETFWRMRGDPERAATMERLARRRLELRRTGGR
jgi:tetratricopeptide (TPR) repeat protein